MVGSYGATVATDIMKQNVYDVPIRGGDAVHPIVGALILNTLLSGQTVKFVSLGMVASSASELASAYGLV